MLVSFLKNLISFKFSGDLGRLIENLVFLELLRNKKELYYWKSQKEEVDFIIKKENRIEQLIQVCYSLENEKTKEREINGLLRASDELKCKNLLVISWDYEAEGEFKGKKIKFIPLWKWLLKFTM